MQRTKWYYGVVFPVDVLREAYDLFMARTETTRPPSVLEVGTRDDVWSYDDRSEFLAECRAADRYVIDQFGQDSRFRVNSGDLQRSCVSVVARSRADINAVFDVFERNVEKSKVIVARDPIKVFVGHGGDAQWRQLKDHLHEQHGFHVVAYEIGPRAGRSVKEVLGEMSKSSDIALLVLTGEDEHTDGKLHARGNVIHELGLFQGALGFSRAIALLEDGVEEFSNILGINQIRFSKGNIRETFGDVLATIKREFLSADSEEE